MRRAPFLLAVVALGAAGLLPAEAAAMRPNASPSAVCQEETKRLNTFKRGMPAAKRRFFRTHKSKRARARFVKRQRAKLAALKRARRRCLADQPPLQQPPGDPPNGGGPAPPPEPLATSVIQNVVSEDAEFGPGAVSVEEGVEYVRTQLELSLAPGATVAQLQALLTRLNATVVSSLAGVPVITVRMPDPGSLDALRALVSGLAGAPGLDHADIQTVPKPTELPSIISHTDVSMVRPQLASRAYAAWNARGALAGLTQPGLVVADFWGAGPPGAEVAVQETASDFATGSHSAHGYTILGLLAGTFAPGAVADPDADAVTGIWPGGDLPLAAVDLQRRIAGSTADDRILQAVQAMPGNVVVNSSYEDGCARAGCTQQQIQRDAVNWLARVRGSALENRFLHVVAAGNIYPDLMTDTTAVLGSHYIAAARMALPLGIPNLSNTIVVENTTASDPAAGAVKPLCMTATSKEGGHISAVGNDIKSLASPGVFRDLPAGGTSSAAPQVAGAAAMVWGLDSTLTPAQVKAILVDTAQPVGNSGDPRCKSVTPAPGLDQYAAVLAVDRATTQPVRAAILDVTGSSGAPGTPDGAFDEQDLQAFKGEIATGQGATVDYSRFDLNGDGRTGGGTARLDLDGVRPVTWGYSDRRDFLGVKVLRDEETVTDVDVLCHEAAGPRYTGDLNDLQTFFESTCLNPGNLPVEIKVDPAFPATVQPGVSTPLRVEATNAAITDAPFAHLPGVRLEYTVSGGTVSAPSNVGVTGSDGSFTTGATLASSASPIEIEIVARAGVGGPELDRLTVTASAGSGPIGVGDGEAFLVANAEADADVKEILEPNFSDSVSAADKDATASANASSSLQLSSGGTGMDFNGGATISAADDGGGGDAGAFIGRYFTVTGSEPLPARISATLGGGPLFGETTFGRVQLYFSQNGQPAANPFFTRSTSGSQTTDTLLSASEYYLLAEIGCTPPRPEGGACAGNMSFALELGDQVGP